VIRATVADRAFALRLVEFFAAAALFLAALGVYGILAYSVTERSAEFGIRLALGASRSAILSLVLCGGMSLTVTGIALGLAASFLLMRLVRGLLFQVRPADPGVLSGAVLILLAAALIACLAPAIRAARMNPVQALRHE
jgi:ABC-type antimicrobial peptide transport system permease subunit